MSLARSAPPLGLDLADLARLGGLMATKMLRSDAEEVLRSLQMVGEGWYIQVGQWIKAGAHKALDMDEREFAQSIGQRLRDPREAIVEMHDQGHSKERIARVLGVSTHTVRDALIDAGRIEGEKYWDRHRELIASGARVSGGGESAAKAASPDFEGETPAASPDSNAVAKAQEEARKAKAQLAEFKAKHKEMAAQVAKQVQAARAEAEGQITEQERARLRKEAEAWAHEQGQKILAGTRRLAVGHVVSAITEATDDLAALVDDGGISGEDMDKISAALAALNEQASVARASVTTVKEDR